MGARSSTEKTFNDREKRKNGRLLTLGAREGGGEGVKGALVSVGRTKLES